jgi:hypothetical protein
MACANAWNDPHPRPSLNCRNGFAKLGRDLFRILKFQLVHIVRDNAMNVF